MQRSQKISLLLLVGLAAASVAPAQQQPAAFVQVVDDFTRGSDAWLADFTDYGLDQGGMDRLAELRDSPLQDEGAETPERSFFVQSMNHSDDIFMFLKKPLDYSHGIAPDTEYEAEFLVEMYSNEPTGCFGVGGSPGDSVYLKMGGHAQEPVSLLGDEGLRLNIDKDNQASGGEDVSLAGTIANGLPCDEENRGKWVKMEVRHTHPNPIRSSSTGELWLVIGTDSGYEGLTQLYYSRIAVTLTRVGGAQ
jgi:hypothetical protein